MKMKMKIISDKLTSTPTKAGVNIFLNPYSYMLLRKIPDLYKSTDAVLIDGQLLVSLLKFCNVKVVKRASFDYTSIAKTTFERLSKNNESLYIVGSTDECINKFTNTLNVRYPGIKIEGTKNGYFNDVVMTDIFQSILKKSPQTVLCGMGTPKQEIFAIKLKNSGYKGQIFTCGGFIHQTASVDGEDYYPKIFDRLNIRWLYRIIDEPKLIKRYLLQYPLALLYILIDIARYKSKG